MEQFQLAQTSPQTDLINNCQSGECGAGGNEALNAFDLFLKRPEFITAMATNNYRGEEGSLEQFKKCSN